MVAGMDEVLSANTLVHFLELATRRIAPHKKVWKVHTLILVADGSEEEHFRRVEFSTWDCEFWKQSSKIDGRVEVELRSIDTIIRRRYLLSETS